MVLILTLFAGYSPNTNLTHFVSALNFPSTNVYPLSNPCVQSHSSLIPSPRPHPNFRSPRVSPLPWLWGLITYHFLYCYLTSLVPLPVILFQLLSVFDGK